MDSKFIARAFLKQHQKTSGIQTHEVNDLKFSSLSLQKTGKSDLTATEDLSKQKYFFSKGFCLVPKMSLAKLFGFNSYVICRVFQKEGPGPRNGAQYDKQFFPTGLKPLLKRSQELDL
ncbi:hypothetical protein RYX36_005533 [Vicia faba]